MAIKNISKFLHKRLIWIIAILLSLPLAYSLPNCLNITPTPEKNITMPACTGGTQGFSASVQPAQTDYFTCGGGGDIYAYSSSGVNTGNPQFTRTNEGQGWASSDNTNIWWNRNDVDIIRKVDYAGVNTANIGYTGTIGTGASPYVALTPNSSQVWYTPSTGASLGQFYSNDTVDSTRALRFTKTITSVKGLAVDESRVFVFNGSNVFEYDHSGTYVCNISTNLSLTAASMAKNASNVFFYEGTGTSTIIFANTQNVSSSSPDTTLPKGNITLNNTSPKRFDFINISINATDETGLSSINYTINYTGNISKFNYTFSGTSVSFSNKTQINVTKGNVLNLTVYITDTSNNVKQNSTFLTVANTEVPAPTNINWLTTGGFTSGTRTFGEILDWVNATCTGDADGDFSSCRVTITDPQGTKQVNNASMSLVNNNIYSYSTDTNLNVAGTWTIAVDSNDVNSVSSDSTTITVITQNLTTIDGWYGYTENTLLTESEISPLATFDYTLIELTVNASKLSSSFQQILNSVNKSDSINIKIGLNIFLDFNYSKNSNKIAFLNNISGNFSMLATDPYQDTIKYISLETNSSSTLADRYNLLNNASLNITQATANKFPIYSKVPIAELDSSYITNTTIKYITAQTHAQWIDSERGLMRNTTSLNRIYRINGTLKDTVDNFHDSIFDIMRGTPVPTTTVGNNTVAELSNGDFIVYNIQAQDNLFYLDFSNVNGISGKDIWDTTNKIYVHSNTNGTGNLNVSAYSATMIFAENFDHIEGSWTLFKATSSGQKTFNYTIDDVNDGNFALDNDADEFRTELFDPHYNKNSFITYYGWINASYLTNWSGYDIVVLDDENRDQVARVLANATATNFFFYISVADYQNTGAWVSGKKTEIDNIIALNESTNINVFIDGLDTGVGGFNFSTKFKELTDYIEVTKNRKVGLNTYTAYETFCSLAEPNGFCMKESCVRRWNGSDASNPSAYDWEDWSLEVNKSIWYRNHNVRVLCQAFDNRTADTKEPMNWTTVQDTFFASKVLGYSDFYISQPDFNFAHTIYNYNVGTDLANEPSTLDNQTYYRRYSNGVVYFNTSNHKGWIVDGREQDVQLCFKLYDNSDGAGDEEKDFVFRVNNISTTDDNQYRIPATSIAAGSWNWYCQKLNESHKSVTGSYKVEGSTSNGGQVADGIYIGWNTAPFTGIHSWYSDQAGDPLWVNYPAQQNWEVKVVVNETKKSSVDTFTTQIIQNSVSSAGRTNLTLSSNNPVELETWSDPITISRFINLTYWNGTAFNKIYPVNTSTCNSNNPSWNTTVIGGESHKSCIETVDTNTIVRVATPHLSTQTYQISSNSAPQIVLIQPLNNTLYNTQPFHINYTITDNEGDSIQQVSIWINGTLNQTITGDTNTTFNASDGKYNLSISAFDGVDWSSNLTVPSFKIDTTNPTIAGMTANSTPYNSNFNKSIIFSDTNLYGVNCTVYNRSSSSQILFSTEIINISDSSQTLNIQYNVSWGDGRYLTECRGSDDHTAKLIEQYSYNIKKQNFITKLFGAKDSIKFEKGGSLSGDIEIISNEDTTSMNVYYLDDRMSYVFDYSGKKAKGILHTYTLYLSTTNNLVQRQSNYEGHFISGKGIGENWIDYEMKNNEDDIYSTSTENGMYKIMITTTKNTLNFTSIGGINIMASNSTIEFDTTTPVSSKARNLTTSGSTAITTSTSVNISANISDLNIANITFLHNASGIFTNHTIPSTSNSTYSYIIGNGNFTSNKVVGWYYNISDSAGNYHNSSIYTFTVGAAPSSPSGSGSGAASGVIGNSPDEDVAILQNYNNQIITQHANIVLEMPSIWITGREVKVNTFFYRNNSAYDPKLIEFTINNSNQIIYKNLSRKDTGSYTATFYVKNVAQTGDYTLTTTATSSPPETLTKTFSVREDSILNDATALAQNTVDDISKIIKTVSGERKEKMTLSQIVILGTTLTMLAIILIAFGFYISKKPSKN